MRKFTARLKQANLARKSDIGSFVKKTNFDDKIKNVTSNKNELNQLPRKLRALSSKGLTTDLRNQFSLLK